VIFNRGVELNKLDKINKVLNIIMTAISEILNNNNDFTGSITINFCLGGVTGITKKENVKV